jgi:lysozyme
VGARSAVLAGIDVSHYQSPSAVPWQALADAGAFCIVRATYGTKRDEMASNHVSRARAHGVRVGVYHFFRASLPVRAQLDAFREAAFAADYGKPLDVVPAIDWEDDGKAPIAPEHAPLAEELCGEVAQAFGQVPLLYITQRDWSRVGRPLWALNYPLWVAHYSSASRLQPATPAGAPWAIWQHRVGPFDLKGPHGYYSPALYDHNVANFLPLLNGMKFGPNHNPLPSPLPEPPDAHATEAQRTALLVELGRQAVSGGFAQDNAELSEAAS